MPEDVIGRVLGAAPAGDAGTQLVDAALAMRVPGQDNVTAIVLACEPDAAPSPITSNVPARSNAWLIAAIVVFAVILMSGAGAFAWYRYRDNRETQRIVKLSADIAAAFTTGNCAKVAELNHDLPEARPDAKDALEKAAKCGRFENFVHEGDVAYDAAGTAASPAEKRGHLQRAATNYQLALDQGIPGEQEAARIRGRITEARDQLARERTEPPPPAREGGAGPQRKPPEQVAADDDDEGHQRVKKPPPPKRPGREQDR